MIQGRWVILGVLLLALVYILGGLLLPLVMGGVLATLVAPWLGKLEKLRVPRAMGAAVLTLGVTLGFLVPIAFLVYLSVREGVSVVSDLRASGSFQDAGGYLSSLVQGNFLRGWLERIQPYLSFNIDSVLATVGEVARSIALRLGEMAGNFFKQIPSLSVSSAIVVVSLYFFLLDGKALVALVRKNTWFTPAQTEGLLRTFSELCRSVILASLASGAAQAAVFIIAAAIIQVPNLGLLTTMVFLASFIPLVGSLPVSLGVIIHQFAVGHSGAAIAMIFVAGAISLIDNFVRPAVLKGAGNLHPLLGFLAAFGGLQVFGFWGIFLGPIVAGLFVRVGFGLESQRTGA